MAAPIARLARWIVTRNDRPASAVKCWECECPVGPTEGTWDPTYRALLCDDEGCALAFQLSWAV